MYFYCEKCKKPYPLNTHSYMCECGGMFRLHKDPMDEVHTEITTACATDGLRFRLPCRWTSTTPMPRDLSTCMPWPTTTS